METVSFKYGNQIVALPVPEQAHRFTFNEPVQSISEETFGHNFERLITTVIISATTKVAIVVADKTRLCGYKRIIPWVVSTLQRKSVTESQLAFYIAYGTHPRQTQTECLAAYGEPYNRYQFVHHDCSDEHCFELLGTTSHGTEVKVRKDVLNSDLIITIGAVSHHYFAGYGGGRKLLFPGLAEKNAIYSNHRLFLNKEQRQLAAGCWPGNLEGNPLASDLKEIHDMLPDYLSIHAILDSDGNPATYHFGRGYDDFLTVCKKLDRCYKIEEAERFDLVVASTGGYPKDINIIQSHKAIHNTANLVRDGGTLIVLAECRDGVGSETFLPYFDMGGRDAAFSELIQHYVGNGGTALAMMEKTERIRICLVTELPEEVCLKIGTEKISLGEAESVIASHSGKVGFVQNGSLLVANRWQTV
jgi:nickel-dependent lactate racemase